MNDEQRCMARFGAQPEGTGPFFRRAALHFAYVHSVHGAQCALPYKKMATVAAVQ